MALRDISRRRSNWVAFGSKRTLGGSRCAPNLSRLTQKGPRNDVVAATAQVKRHEGERTNRIGGMLFMERAQGERLLRLDIRLTNNPAIGLMLATNERGKVSPADANWVETLAQ